MKMRRRRGGPRIATKALEGALVKRAEGLREDPDILFPRCVDHDDHFFKYKIRFEKISRFSENEKKLTALTRRGDPLSRAFATSLLIAYREEVPKLLTIKFAGKDISFVHNPKVKREVMVGVQYYDDPDLRLLAFDRIAKLKRLHLYSMKDDFVCTGKEDKPPAKYVGEVLSTAKGSFVRKGKSYACVHCEREGSPYLKITWIAPEVEVMICESCAKDENTYQTLTKRYVSIEPKLSFDIEVFPNYVLECGDVSALNSQTQPSKDLIAKYMDKTITDNEFIEKHMDHVRTHVPPSGEITFALGNRCYGNDTEAFIDALNPSNVERIALEALLEDFGENIVVESATPNKILMMYWDDYGEDVLEALVDDRSLAEKVFETGQKKKWTPSKVIEVAMSKAKKEAIDSSLPSYRGLPPLANFADRVARLYKAKGKESAITAVSKESGQDMKIKSMRYAFLLALNVAKGKEWQFTKEQLDFGKFLKDFAEKLMEAEGDEYHESLQNLLVASGSSEKI